MPGIMMINPGPLTSLIRPKRKTTALSYSFNTRIADAKNINTSTITTISGKEKLPTILSSLL
jgi:hypothetical protein